MPNVHADAAWNENDRLVGDFLPSILLCYCYVTMVTMVILIILVLYYLVIGRCTYKTTDMDYNCRTRIVIDGNGPFAYYPPYYH